MAKKKAKEQDEDRDETTEGDEEETSSKKSKKSKKSAKGKDKGEKSSKKKSKAKSEDEDGYVSIATLADEAGINAQSARVKLREAELGKPEGGRWRWKENSKDLKAARKALDL